MKFYFFKTINCKIFFRNAGNIDPRVHEPWLDEHRGMERLDRPDHFPPHGPPARHRHQPEWTGGRQAGPWDRHKHARYNLWKGQNVLGLLVFYLVIFKL